MLDGSANGNAAVLVGLDFGDQDFADSLLELEQLALSAGIQVRAIIKGKRERPDPSLFAGSGKVDEIAQAVLDTSSSIVIFNHDISPAQERNLEQKLECRVVDRTHLILDIFAQRARSHEGKLQVELAQLEHLSTRLVRGWTHLERQKGGIGLRGPGETQLETDRRLIAKRVKLLKDKLSRLGLQRHTQRKARRRARTAAVSIVGYTNAGKSTLFNLLTRAQAYAADQLFATLDTTSRQLYREGQSPLIISDTVGFIQQLPHSLIEAFRATLDEATEADCLVHVVDAGSNVREQQIAAVNKVLSEIGAETVPQILVFNKIDLIGLPPRIERDDKMTRVWLSAKTGAGLDLLRSALAEIGSASHSTETEYRTVA